MLKNRSVPTDTLLPHIICREVAHAIAWLIKASDDSGVDRHKRIIDADHKLISDQKARDSQYAVSCSSIAGVSRRS
jgi:hypothetical protein